MNGGYESGYEYDNRIWKAINLEDVRKKYYNDEI